MTIIFNRQIRKSDAKKFKKLIAEMKKHIDHHIGMVLSPMGLHDLTQGEFYILSVSCDDCKEIIGLGWILAAQAHGVHQLVYEIEEDLKRRKELIVKAPPDFEKE